MEEGLVEPREGGMKDTAAVEGLWRKGVLEEESW